MSQDENKDTENTDDTTDPKDTKPTKAKPLPLTETLVLDIVDYLLNNKGYGYSTQISSFMVNYKPRRYTSREVVGILRNRPMFRHAQSKERRGGIRWRLDLLALSRYLEQKGFQNRAEERGIYEKIQQLKWSQLKQTIDSLEAMDTRELDDIYESIATLWS
ncbi:MAG: hypothetical protein CL398_00340 [Acidiferrobacteraceae bacterium]|nr:hypothetical protein [Acidiferrobacteraceae bacterium]|tara:strand:- start:1456 stop:1938 length:483 start_codon:yes stop_codon:yes gene_type:complete